MKWHPAGAGYGGTAVAVVTCRDAQRVDAPQEPTRAEKHVRVPPEGFEPSHLAPEASALSPELWGLANGERLPVPGGACDIRAVHDHSP